MITRSERNWLLTLRSRLTSYGNTDGIDRIVAAVRVIESEHRNRVWRFAEYVHVAVDGLSTRSRFITNISIGVYQLKVTMILDYFHKSYILSGKRVFLHADSQKDIVRLILQNRNNASILRFYIEQKFPQILDTSNESVLIDFALEYSRNISFEKPINYASVLRFITSANPSWSLFH